MYLCEDGKVLGDLLERVRGEQALRENKYGLVLLLDPELLRLLVDLDERVGELLLGRDLEVGKVRAVLVVGDLADLAEGGDGAANDGAGLGITDRGLDLEETWEKLGDERAHGDVRVDELGHVVDDAKPKKISKMLRSNAE